MLTPKLKFILRIHLTTVGRSAIIVKGAGGRALAPNNIKKQKEVLLCLRLKDIRYPTTFTPRSFP